jgi:hypothetical protein
VRRYCKPLLAYLDKESAPLMSFEIIRYKTFIIWRTYFGKYLQGIRIDVHANELEIRMVVNGEYIGSKG